MNVYYEHIYSFFVGFFGVEGGGLVCLILDLGPPECSPEPKTCAPSHPEALPNMSARL